MNLQKVFSSLWTMLTRTRMMRFVITIFAILVAVRYIQNARSGRHAEAGGGRRGAGGGTRRNAGASSSRPRSSRRNAAAPSGGGQRAQRADEEDLKNRSPREVYLAPSRRRYQICVSTSCVFSHSRVPSGEAAVASKRAELAEGASIAEPTEGASIPSSGDDEHKVDPSADASPSASSPSAFSPSDADGEAAGSLSLNLASEQCGAILSKLCEHHDLYLVCQLSGGLLGAPSSPSASSGDGASAAFSSSTASASHDAATKAVIDFCRELCLFDNGLKKHRVVFCTTDVGRTAIMRQLEPHLLIEDNPQNAQQLAKVLPNSRVVVTRALAQKNARVTDVDGFESFFAKSS